jgi:hypothetical protein
MSLLCLRPSAVIAATIIVSITLVLSDRQTSRQQRSSDDNA